jgi:EAL domain-containing protein (putative c-di-GMP-specific phosphodiesterase class I)
MSEREDLLALLGQAMEHGQFDVFFQPEYSAADGRPIGVESLIRWRHPQRGLVPPAVFLAICEDSGLILPLGQWVLAQACEYHARLAKAGWAGIPISVNISASQFRDPGLVDSLNVALGRHSLPSGYIELELPESVVTADPGHSEEVLSAVRALGVGIVIGDFGTGFSSMTTLYRVPADRIKIDRSVVRNVPFDAHNSALCRSIVSLAHGKGLKAVAEGVETHEEHEWLRANGCDGVQGYLFARPAPFDDMLKALGPLPG